MRFFILLCLAAASLSAQTKLSEPDFGAIERAWLKAQDEGDAAVLARMYDDEFLGTTFTGKVLTRNDILPSDEGPRTPAAPSVLEEVRQRIYGDSAVVLGLVRAGELRYRFTKMYVRKGAEWKLVAAHLSRVQ